MGASRAAFAATLLLLAGCGTDSAPTANSGGEPVAGHPRVDLVAVPAISVSPTSFHFLVYAFRPSYEPPGQALNIKNGGGGTLRWTAKDNAFWLSLSATSGAAPSKVIVRASRASLPIGFNGYRPTFLQGTITVSAANASNTPKTIPVSLSISYVHGPGRSRRRNPLQAEGVGLRISTFRSSRARRSRASAFPRPPVRGRAPRSHCHSPDLASSRRPVGG